MTEIEEILSETSHRPFELPFGNWIYYQEWNDALFFHWTVDYDVLRKLVPEKLNIDSYDGECYISLVAFTMQKIRPRHLPSIKPISEFHEINLRTYVEYGNKKGVYFLNIEAEKILSTYIAKLMSGLPYEKSNIKRFDKKYASKNILKGFYFDTEFLIKDKIVHKTMIDQWLTERYCLYLEKNNNLYRYDIHHNEWALNNLELTKFTLNYKIGDLHLTDIKPILTHYSPGVKVIAWRRERI